MTLWLAELFLWNLGLYINQTCCPLPLGRYLGKNVVCTAPWWRKEVRVSHLLLIFLVFRGICMFACVGKNLNGCGSPELPLPLHWSLLRSGGSGSDQSLKEMRRTVPW